uniref:Uncharacterized protein n=1 Tax=Arundo donax TaxID=35708 RepID=A0A0A9ANN1_ARUDO
MDPETDYFRMPSALLPNISFWNFCPRSVFLVISLSLEDSK